MKICIDATPIGINTTDKGGVYRYIYELVCMLSLIDPENQYILFFNFFKKEHLPAYHKAVERLRVGENFYIKLSRFPPRLRGLIDFPVELLAGRFDVFHGCFDYLPPILSGRGVVTIHDIRYLEDIEDRPDPEWVDILKKTTPCPELYIKDYSAMGDLFNHLRLTIRETIQRADAIITVSQFCKNRMVELLSIPEKKIRVIYHGVDRRFRYLSYREIMPVLKRYGIERPYILYTGKLDPLKNLIRLIEAFKKVTTSYDVTLVLAGPINWFYYILVEKARQLDIMDKIIFTNFVADEDIVALYSGASVFTFPSLYEGFGIPLVEAMACRVPIVTSKLSSIPEVVGNSALFVDHSSTEDITQGIIQCLTDKRLREELINEGIKRVESFTWERTARETLQVYNDTLLYR